MRVAGVEPVGDAPAGLVEHCVLTPDCPLTGETPMIGAQGFRNLVGAAIVERGSTRRGEPLAALVAEIGLGRAQVLPVGLRLHAEPFDGHGLALDVEQALDHALRLLVTPLAEVLVADDPVLVDEVQRRPVVVWRTRSRPRSRCPEPRRSRLPAPA